MTPQQPAEKTDSFDTPLKKKKKNFPCSYHGLTGNTSYHYIKLHPHLQLSVPYRCNILYEYITTNSHDG